MAWGPGTDPRHRWPRFVATPEEGRAGSRRLAECLRPPLVYPAPARSPLSCGTPAVDCHAPPVFGYMCVLTPTPSSCFAAGWNVGAGGTSVGRSFIRKVGVAMKMPLAQAKTDGGQRGRMNFFKLVRRWGPWLALLAAAGAYYPRFIKDPNGMTLYPRAAECMWMHEILRNCAEGAEYFTYPPAFGFLMMPFVPMPLGFRNLVWYAITLAAMIVSFWLCDYLVRRLIPGHGHAESSSGCAC